MADNRLSVLHVTTRFVRGGAERNIERVMRAEQASGFDVRLVVGAGSDPSELPRGFDVRILPRLGRSVRPAHDLAAFVTLRRLIAELAPDVVHTHESKAGVLGRLAARGRARAVTHSIHIPSFGPSHGRTASTAFVAAERLCARTTDTFLTVGDELRRLYVRHGIGHREQFLTLRSPVAVERYAGVRGSARSAARAALGIDPELPLALAAGRLEDRKRHALLVRELAPLLRAGRLQLAIAGEGPNHHALEALAAELGCARSVRLLGHCERLEQIFAAADLLVHAATAEGVSQVVLQALAAGVPVVATDVEGLREIPDAPIRVVDRAGAGIGNAVTEMLRAPAVAVPPDALAAWTDEAVDGQIEAYLRHLQVCVERRPRAHPSPSHAAWSRA